MPKEKIDPFFEKVVPEFLKAIEEDIEIAPPRPRRGSMSTIVSFPFIREDGHFVEAEVRKLLSGYVRISDMESQMAELFLLLHLYIFLQIRPS